jgi:predicted TIM-barrel fold metal-dependent hydrolase
VICKKANDHIQNLKCLSNDVTQLFKDFNCAVKVTTEQDSDLVELYTAMRAHWSNERKIWGADYPYPKTVAEAYNKKTLCKAPAASVSSRISSACRGHDRGRYDLAAAR